MPWLDAHEDPAEHYPFFGHTFQPCIEHLHGAEVAQPARKIWIADINQ
jgi:hypothetical protein